MRLLLPAGLFLLAGSSNPAFAQIAPRTAFPGGFAPGTAMCVVQPDQSCQVVSATNPFPTAAANGPARDGNGDLRVPTVTVTPFFVSLPASTSTELLAANATRLGYDVQCTGTAPVALSRTHAVLTSATPAAGGADLIVPTGSLPYFQPAYVSGAGVTAFTTTAQTCWGVSYARQ